MSERSASVIGVTPMSRPSTITWSPGCVESITTGTGGAGATAVVGRVNSVRASKIASPTAINPNTAATTQPALHRRVCGVVTGGATGVATATAGVAGSVSGTAAAA